MNQVRDTSAARRRVLRTPWPRPITSCSSGTATWSVDNATLGCDAGCSACSASSACSGWRTCSGRPAGRPARRPRRPSFPSRRPHVCAAACSTRRDSRSRLTRTSSRRPSSSLRAGSRTSRSIRTCPSPCRRRAGTGGSPSSSDTSRPGTATYVFYLQFQLNPTDVGRRTEDVELNDGTRPIVRIERTATVFP